MTNVAKISKKPFVGFSHDFFVTIVGKFTRKKTEQHMPHYLSIKEGSLLVFFFFFFSTLSNFVIGNPTKLQKLVLEGDN
jgi:hypothetical protein